MTSLFFTEVCAYSTSAATSSELATRRAPSTSHQTTVHTRSTKPTKHSPASPCKPNRPSPSAPDTTRHNHAKRPTTGPILRWREGDTVTLRVANALPHGSIHGHETSIHWHGILLPANMDGVPGLSFHGIPPGETYNYRFRVQQGGTYWYHSHSAFQEQAGLYGPIVIEPLEPEPFAYDRDYVVLLSDWTDMDAGRVVRAPEEDVGLLQLSTSARVGDFVARRATRRPGRHRSPTAGCGAGCA